MQLYEPLLPVEQAYRAKDGAPRREARRDAVAKALTIFEQNRDRESVGQDDPLSSHLSESTFKWLSETVVQGAYIREYHAWEKEVKSYLDGQCYLNGKTAAFEWRPGKEGLVALVVRYLDQFSVKVSDITISIIDNMRVRVNEMKHTPSFFEDHLVSREEFDRAAQAIEDFWMNLERRQVWALIRPGPHIDRYLETL